MKVQVLMSGGVGPWTVVAPASRRDDAGCEQGSDTNRHKHLNLHRSLLFSIRARARFVTLVAHPPNSVGTALRKDRSENGPLHPRSELGLAEAGELALRPLSRRDGEDLIQDSPTH